MAEQRRTVFVKLSGESLAVGAEDGADWKYEAAEDIGSQVAEVQEHFDELAINGLTLISGAGNIARGAKDFMKKIFGDDADLVGRLATMQNTLAISNALTRHNVAHVMMLTDKMSLRDKALAKRIKTDGADTPFERYSVQASQAAHREGKVVLIAGGTGDDNATTDQAIVFYARDYRNHGGGEVTILKGTSNVDGVYDKDPLKVGPDEAPAKRYKMIGAKQMLADYERYRAVDKTSLEYLLDEENLSLLVYRTDTSLLGALARDPRLGESREAFGTVIVPNLPDPIFY